MTRRRRVFTSIPSPLIGQGFQANQAAKAVVQLVGEVHRAHYNLDAREAEEVVREAIDRARLERGGRGEK